MVLLMLAVLEDESHLESAWEVLTFFTVLLDGWSNAHFFLGVLEVGPPPLTHVPLSRAQNFQGQGRSPHKLHSRMQYAHCGELDFSAALFLLAFYL